MTDLASRLESASPEQQRADLIALAERVERAEGPSRELDCLIYVTAYKGGAIWQDNMLFSAADDGSYGMTDPGSVQRNFTCWRSDVLAFTASLDAALTLVPEGAGRGAFAMNRDRFGRTHCNVWTDVEFNRKCHGSGATPALALCAAALRARVAA